MFKVGEKVGFLYENGGGLIVKQLSSSTFLVNDSSDFERVFQLNELVKIHSEDYKLPEDEELVLLEDDTFSENLHTIHRQIQSGSKKSIEVWELDLHIEEIVESHRGMSNFQILSRQLSELKSFVKKAKAKHIRKLVIIHGVGEGVLKEEVRNYLAKQTGFIHYDADFREYGKGATAVEINYNID